MTIKECPICHQEIDKRGYTQHYRKCKEQEEIREQKKADEINEIKKTIEEDNTMTDNELEDTPITESKNSKAPRLKRMIISVVGVTVLIVVSILMLILPKSKELKQEPTLKTKRPGSRRHQ